MKKLLFLLLSVCFLLFSSTFAKQWCCSWHWWVSYCWSNWYYVCNDWWRGSSCKCWTSSYTNSYTNSFSNSYTYSYPTYSYSYPTYTVTVDKNLECKNQYWDNAYYSSYDQQCSCNYWYVLNTLNGVKRCLNYDENCQAMHWEQSYHIWNSSCWCKAGYLMVDWKCVPKDDSCIKTYWENSFYDLLTKSCSCKNWYVMYKWTACITATESCQRQYGTKSKAWEPWYCVCMDWYVWDEKWTQCISEDKAYCWIYWSQSYLKDNKCYCKDWYEWNSDMTKCIEKKKTTPVVNNNLNNISENSNIQYTVKTLTDEEKKFRTEKNKVMSDLPEEDDDLIWSMINLMEKWAIDAKWRLWEEANKLKAIIPAVLESDEETQKKFVDTVLVLQNDKNQHTADVWNYLKFLLIYWDI